MELIVNVTKKYHVSLDTVVEFEQTILSDGTVCSLNSKDIQYAQPLVLLWKVWDMICEKLGIQIRSNLKKKNTHQKHLFAVLMGTNFSQCLPYFVYPANKSIYLFDSWPTTHDKIERFVNLFKINNIFFTSFQTNNIFQAKLTGTNCYWIPEGIKPELYSHFPYEEKTIDVLALGRRHEAYHARIVDDLRSKKKVYLYANEKEKLIFPTREDFVVGLAKTKLSICFPSSITHPNRAGNIETMTMRYLQSMVSKCIVVGHAPKEMITLFGYNPVVEVDQLNPAEQIQSILANYSDYFPLVEKNYNAVIRDHTWANRWHKIRSILAEER